MKRIQSTHRISDLIGIAHFGMGEQFVGLLGRLAGTGRSSMICIELGRAQPDRPCSWFGRFCRYRLRCTEFIRRRRSHMFEDVVSFAGKHCGRRPQQSFGRDVHDTNQETLSSAGGGDRECRHSLSRMISQRASASHASAAQKKQREQSSLQFCFPTITCSIPDGGRGNTIATLPVKNSESVKGTTAFLLATGPSI